MNDQALKPTDLEADVGRLLDRIQALGNVGALEGGGVCRLALTDADREGRNLVHSWMKDLGLSTRIDRIGNDQGIPPQTPVNQRVSPDSSVSGSD